MLSVVVAVIGFAGTIIAALITARATRQAGAVSAPHPAGPSATMGMMNPSLAKVSRSYRWAIGACFAWLIPFAGYTVIAIGLCYAIRDSHRGMSRTTVTIVICLICLVLTLINSAIGAYQGAHGTLFTPYG